MSDTPKPTEMRLIRRLRTLTSGAHLCIINVDADGIYSINFIGNGKPEKIRHTGDFIGTANPAPRSLEQ